MNKLWIFAAITLLVGILFLPTLQGSSSLLLGWLLEPATKTISNNPFFNRVNINNSICLWNDTSGWDCASGGWNVSGGGGGGNGEVHNGTFNETDDVWLYNSTPFMVNLNLTAVNNSLYVQWINSSVETNWNGNYSLVFDNLSDLWLNASYQQTNITTLFSNASSQQDSITSLWSNASTQWTFILGLVSNDTTIHLNLSNLWVNASDQRDLIKTLDTNASAQQDAITLLWSNASVQWTFITGLIANDTDIYSNLSNVWLNASYQQANLTTIFGNLTNLETACGAGYYAYAKANNGTLLCRADSEPDNTSAGNATYYNATIVNSLFGKNASFSGSLSVTNDVSSYNGSFQNLSSSNATFLNLTVIKNLFGQNATFAGVCNANVLTSYNGSVQNFTSSNATFLNLTVMNSLYAQNVSVKGTLAVTDAITTNNMTSSNTSASNATFLNLTVINSAYLNNASVTANVTMNSTYIRYTATIGGTTVNTTISNDTVNASYHSINPNPATQVGSGVIINATVGENVVYGNVLYFKSDGKYWKASASASTTVPVVGMALETINANYPGKILLLGYARDDTWSALTVGGYVWLSTTSGAFTQTQPAASGNEVQALGIAVASKVIYFNPSLVVVEVA